MLVNKDTHHDVNIHLYYIYNFPSFLLKQLCEKLLLTSSYLNWFEFIFFLFHSTIAYFMFLVKLLMVYSYLDKVSNDITNITVAVKCFPSGIYYHYHEK